MVRVMVAGKFDPLHLGHILHIKYAKKLGDELVVVTHSDEVLKKIKGRVDVPLEQRIEALMELKSVDRVELSIDGDGTVAETFRWIRPDIFAKGGDRTPDNMPSNELWACEKMGIRIIYGVGRRLASSTDIMKEIKGG